ncbi:MAG: hypothetical protein ACOX5R_00445 [bacterium]|jgi:hypothetical protein
MNRKMLLCLLCSVIQILGLFLFLAGFASPALPALIGFAAIVNFFLTEFENLVLKTLFSLAGICGILLITLALLSA